MLEAKNNRRCDLIDKEIAGTLSSDEQVELEQLQTEMLAYRHKVAPLPHCGYSASLWWIFSCDHDLEAND